MSTSQKLFCYIKISLTFLGRCESNTVSNQLGQYMTTF